jgi:soluble lytic murein transglycosylase
MIFLLFTNYRASYNRFQNNLQTRLAGFIFITMHKLFLRFITILVLFGSAAFASSPYNITPKDKTALEKALYFANKKEFDQARFEASKATDKDILKLILWFQYQEQYSGNDYSAISQFLKNNPSWPSKKKLINNAEESLSNMIPAKTIISYFNGKAPITSHAMLVLAEAKIVDNGNTNEINSLLRQSWIQGDFSKDEEDDILQKYGQRLRVEDHVKRADRLLWEDKLVPAKRMIGKVDPANKSLFLARIMFMENKKGISAPVDDSLKQDPGLLYEKVSWQLERENYEQAYQILSRIKDPMPYQEKWWKLKNLLIRELLKDKNYPAAYSLALHHGNESGGEDYAEAEWLAGWISLEFLGDSTAAYYHFYNLYNNVSYPVSKSRGAYWAARSAAKNNDPENAKKWYEIAAASLTTFYGQLAYTKLHPSGAAKIPEISLTPEARSLIYQQNDLIKVAYLLTSIGENKLSETFIIAAINSAKSPEEMLVVSEIGNKTGLTQLSVIASKHALRKGIVLSNNGWPILNNIDNSGVETPLVLGLIRQESSFDSRVKSPANAMGLMQLLPATAKQVAKKKNIIYHANKLIDNPNYNIQLGSSYLGELINRFDGSYILAIASYNAGAGNVRKWINIYGDPRGMSTEGVINWLESIPFNETRSYVQRVLENTGVYRSKTNGGSFALDDDLRRANTKISTKEDNDVL